MLALPAASALRLSYPLHTALQVRLLLPTGREQAATATVEEVSHEGNTTSALLVQLQELQALPPGTEIWLEAEETEEL
jgi:hypothetical protein